MAEKKKKSSTNHTICDQIYTVLEKHLPKILKIFYDLAGGDFMSRNTIVECRENKTIIANEDIFCVYIHTAETHKVVFMLENAELESYGTLKEISANNPALFRCHKSVLVNPMKIESINNKDRSITLSNGQKCRYSRRKYRPLLDTWFEANAVTGQ